MAEQIYTIPISEAFEQHDGCPLCRMKEKLERESLEYVMGAAMMDPDVRIRTNRLGFCRGHYDDMLAMKNRLSLALMLESHLAEVSKLFPENADQLPELPPPPPMPEGHMGPPPDMPADLPEEMRPIPMGPPPRFARFRHFPWENPAHMALVQSKSCYVCRRAAEFERNVLSNVAHMWKKDESFREKLRSQEYFCLDHYGRLLHVARHELNDPGFRELYRALTEINARYIRALNRDVTAFCRSFDHQNAGKPLTEGQRTCTDRACDFLSGK